MGDMLCALCIRQNFLDVESERTSPHVVRPAETLFKGTATCWVHLEDLYANTPITQTRGPSYRLPTGGL